MHHVSITPTPREGEWLRPSHCESSSCVEVLSWADRVFVRNYGGNVVGFSLDEWRAHVAAVKAGEYDF